MKNKMIIVVVFLIFFMIGFLGVRGFLTQEKEKAFDLDGFHITLIDQFQEEEMDGVTVYLESDYVGIAAYQEPFTDLEIIGLNKNSTLDEYMQLVIQNNGGDEEIKHENDLTYVEYEKEIDGETYYYFVTTFKGEDSFWVVNFFSLKDNKNTYRDDFIKWAQSIEV